MNDLRPVQIKRLIQPLRVRPGSTVKLPKDFDPGYTNGYQDQDSKKAKDVLRQGVELLADYQDRLYAQDTHAVLVVLQGIDAAGKDGTIRHVMSGVNPQAVDVHSFKVPSVEELDHDYLWRYSQRLPSRGKIGIFNRSHYEEVLVVRVHPHFLDAQRLPPKTRKGIWERRYREINQWEHYLTDNGIHVVKLFLNLSKAEQRRRFVERIEKPKKNWKFSAADIQERAFWDDYQSAYSDMLSNTTTEWAPWYVIPADNKWFARIAAAAVIAHALIEIDPKYPAVSGAARAALQTALRNLKKES